MPRKILYINNPISGTGSKDSLREKIINITTNAGIPFYLQDSVTNGDYTFLQEKILLERITDVVIVGGDGTVNGVVKSLKHLDVQFGIIPTGSGNGLAFSAGIPRNIDKALQIIFNGNTLVIDAFLVNNKFACMLCGLGFDGKVAHDFATAPKRGLVTYAKHSIRNFFSAKAYPFVIEIDGNKLQANAFFISIANSNQYGNHFTIAPKASLTDGLLDVVVMSATNKISLLLQILKQLAGHNKIEKVESLNKKAGIYFQTPHVKIYNMSLAPIHIDGEPAETANMFEIKVLRSCFKLLCP
jgi:YegS/Rv2252/BmrU family lipid kinase